MLAEYVRLALSVAVMCRSSIRVIPDELLCRDALEQLYSAGAKRFAVWDLCAGEAVPLAHTLNNLMNTVNAVLQGIRALDARQNALRDFTKTFVVGGLVKDHC